MSTAKPRLGKGLEALIPKTLISSGKTIATIPIAMIARNPYQPRRVFSEEELSTLTDSIKKYGVNQPILVRKRGDKYELIAGERRVRASMKAGKEVIPAIIKEVTDRESLQLALIENLERSDLNPIEEALGYERLINEFNLSQGEVAEIFGRNRSTIANRLRLLKLPKNIMDAIQVGRLTEGHARALITIQDPEMLQREFLAITEGSLNVREVEARSAKRRAGRKSPNQMALFADIEKELSETYQSKIKITGSEKKGRITIQFKTQEQLQNILSVLKGIS